MIQWMIHVLPDEIQTAALLYKYLKCVHDIHETYRDLSGTNFNGIVLNTMFTDGE